MAEFCSIATRSAGQSIVGTAAADTSAWLVVEYRQPWEAKGIERADFGPRLRPRVDAWMKSVGGLRAQLIRTPGTNSGPLTAYVGVSAPGAQQLRRLEVADHDAMAEVDVAQVIAAMRRGDDPGVGVSVERPLVMVCTHGKRDPCCAKWGTPVYEALIARDDIELWQTSHLGGHRFAATLLCLPEGMCYGWVEPAEVGELVDAHRRGEVYRLDRLRGRTALSAPGQAAEHFVREATGERRIDAVTIESIETTGPDQFSARGVAVCVPYRVEFSRATLADQAPPSCGKEPAAVQRYELSSLTAL